MIFIHTDTFRNRSRCPLTVSGHHYNPGDSLPPKKGNHLRGFLPQRVLYTDDCGKPAVDRQIKMRIFPGQKREFLLLAFRYTAFLILKYEMITADDGLFSLYGGGDAVGYDIFHLRVHLLMFQFPLFGGLYHGLGHRMREMLFQTGGNPQHFRLLLPAKGNNLLYHSPGPGKSSRLVENNSSRLCCSLQVFSSLYRNPPATGLPDCREHRYGHGKLQGAGEIHHQNRDGLGHISREQ